MANETITPSAIAVADERRFQEQCYLIDFIDQIYLINKEKTYKNFVKMVGDPGTIVNRLHALGAEDIFELTTAQHAALQPKIRLFKTIPINDTEDTDVELHFHDYMDLSLQSLVGNRGIRGAGIGLKSINFEDMGTNPGDSGKAFKVNIVVHFQNAADMFLKQENEDGYKASFADLFRTPPARFNKNNELNHNSFRIKLQIGWSVNKSDLFSDKLREALELSTTTLYLETSKHTLEYRTDRAVVLTIEYMGGIEAEMLSPNMNVLIPDEKTQQQIKMVDNLIKNTETSLSSIQTKIIADNEKKSLSDEITKAGMLLGDAIGDLDISKVGKIQDIFVSNDELVRDRLQEDVEAYQKQRKTLVNKNRISMYQNLLAKLEKNGRLFYIDLPKEYVGFLARLNNEPISKEQKATKRQLFLKQYRETSKRGPTIEGTNKNITSVDSLKPKIASLINTDNTGAVDDFLNGKNTSNVAKSPQNYRVNYFFLGDIIDAALDTIQEQNNASNKSKFRFLLGPVQFLNPSTNVLETTICLSDVPISVDLFQAWFVKKVVKPQLDDYLLRQFLSDLCGELVNNILRPECFGEIVNGVSNRVAVSTFSLPITNKDPLCPNSISAGIFGDNIVNVDNILIDELKGLRKGQHNISDFKHYFMIYIFGSAARAMDGNYEKDIQRGVYHFFVGSDVGLVKKIEFYRTDIQYMREMRITDKKDISEGGLFISEPYNARVSLIGNNIFKPGMMVYIDPDSLGMGSSVSKDERIPIGGYYNVVKVKGELKPGVYTTDLDLNWQADPFDPKIDGITPSEPNNGETERSIDSISIKP